MKKSKPVNLSPAPYQTNILPIIINTIDDKYRVLVENSTHAFFLATPEGTILEINRAATVIFGYSEEEFKNICRQQIIDHSDPDFILALQERAQKGYVTAEATGIRKNGEIFPLEFSSAYFTDDNDNIRISTILTDITERKAAAAAQKENEHRYKIFLQQSSEGIWCAELNEPMHIKTPLEEMIAYCYYNSFIAECNDAFALMYGFTNAAEMIGMPLSRIMPKENPVNIEYLAKFFSNGFKVIEEISYEYHKDGKPSVYVNNMVGIIEGDFIKRAWGIQRDITRQKKAEIELLKANERNDLIARATNDAVWDWDVPSNTIWGNESYNQLLGFNTPSGINDYDAFLAKLHPDDRTRMITNFNKAVAAQSSTLTEEFRCKVTDGSYRIFYDRAHLLYDSNGNLYRMSGAMLDITERKKTEQALAESENHLRTIVQTNPQCIKLLTEDGILLEMNPAGLDMIEADNAAQVIGRKIAEIIVPQHRDAFNKLHKDAFKGKTGKLEFTIIGLKGKQRHLQTHAVPLKNADGTIIAVLGITRDITENKNAQALLLASEERYRYLFNNNPASIIIWDIDDLSIIEVNETAIDIYGYSKKEFLELSVLDLRPKDEHTKFLEMVELARQNEFDKKTMTWQHLTKNGVVIIMEISSHTINYNGKSVVLALGKNVTDKILLENSLAEERQIRHQQITDAVITGQEKERSQLGEELHDNINQILATTRLYIECALTDDTLRMELINDSKIMLEKAMLEIRKLSTTLLPPSLGEIGLLDALEDLIENIKEVNALQIETNWSNFSEDLLSEKLKLTIFRIVQEQLNNIIKHSQAATAFISLKKINKIIRLNIKDDGIGFNMATKRNGVGLRNITSRAEVNNGTVVLESQPGAGCKIEVSFSIPERTNKNN